MSRRGRQKTDEAILAYISDLLAPGSADEEAKPSPSPTGSTMPAEKKTVQSGRSEAKRQPTPERALYAGASRPVDGQKQARTTVQEPPSLSRLATLTAPRIPVKTSPLPGSPPPEPAPPPVQAPVVQPPPVDANLKMQVETPPQPREVPPTRHVPPDASTNFPAWADERFQVLLFDVAGLKLAVPLISLGSIYPLEDRLTHLFGMPDWFMGLMPKGDLKIKVVDTALWVMPEKYRPEMREQARFVVTLHGTEWGLASHEIHESMTLHRDDVRWRRSRGKRPWLAGTVVKQMCALLDVDVLTQLLKASEVRVSQPE